MTVARRRQMARLEKLATHLSDRKSKQRENRTPIEDELEEIVVELLTSDERIELSELCDVADNMRSGSSALPPANRQRFQELVANASEAVALAGQFVGLSERAPGWCRADARFRLRHKSNRRRRRPMPLKSQARAGPHHLRVVRSRTLGNKVSDELTAHCANFSTFCF
jgi:hypothetical protein